MIKKRDKLRVLAKYSSDDGVHGKFKEARNKARQAIDKARATNIKNKISSNTGSPRKFWANLKKLMPGKKGSINSNQNSKISLVDDDGCPLEDDFELSNYANKYFVSVGPNLASEIADCNRDNYFLKLQRLMDDCSTIDSFAPITLRQLEQVVKSINTTKSSNIEGINNALFKNCLLSTLDQVCYLYNLVLLTAEIPESWKKATVVPIFKEGTKTLISNYRPISLLPQIVECFEKLVHARMMTFFNTQQYLM